MCSPAVCGTCKKITYTGCGLHLDEVFANVPEDQRCTCGGAPSASGASGAAATSLRR